MLAEMEAEERMQEIEVCLNCDKLSCSHGICEKVNNSEATRHGKSGRQPSFIFHGERMSIVEVAKRSGVKVGVLRRRVYEKHMTIDQAVAAGAPTSARRYPFYGEMLTLREAEQKTGISRNTLYFRIQRGMSLEAAAEKSMKRISQQNT